MNNMRHNEFSESSGAATDHRDNNNSNESSRTNRGWLITTCVIGVLVVAAVLIVGIGSRL